MDKSAHIKRMLASMQAEKQKHEKEWLDCFAVTFPERSHGLQSEQLTSTETAQKKTRIYDSTASDGCKVGAATIMGATVPSNALWFGLDIGQDASDDESRFVDDMARFMWQNLNASNFQAEAMDALIDTMAAGWFVLYQDAAKGGGYHFELWPLGECWINSSRAANKIDVVYRKYTPSVSQMVAEFGIDKVSAKVREQHANKQFDALVPMVHAIEPREFHSDKAKTSDNLPFSSIHLEIDSNHVCREAGYHEFPCMIPRWSRIPASVYSTGPMSNALADVRTLNEMAMYALIGAESVIAPALKVADDGVINVRNFRVGPRKILVCADVNNIQPLLTGAKVEYAELKMQTLQASIKKMLLADQLPPADGPVKTAYEWSVRVDMMRKILGPMFSRFESEFLQPLVERTFGITWRANELSGFQLVGKPPESLLNKSFSIRFLNPMARSQRIEDVNAMDRYEQALGMAAQIDPSVLDVYDGEAAQRERAELLGVPNKLMREPKKVIEIRQARAEAQAKQQEQMQAANGQAELQGAMAQRMANAA